MRGTAHFIIIAPAAVDSVIIPDWNGVRPKPICSSSGNRNGSAPVPTRKTKPPPTPARNVGSLNSDRSITGAGTRRAWTM